MIQIPVNIQVGINGKGGKGGVIFLNEETIGNTSSWAGSYHILSMGRHYRDYIFYPSQDLREIPDFPTFDCFSQLTTKNKSQQVIGNIGECIAAIFARTRLSAKISDIALLKTDRRIKIPDYLMNLEGHLIRNMFLEKNIDATQYPYLNSKNWWPVESKATRDIQKNDPRKEALIQLISFWSENLEKFPDSVGYGLIISFVYIDTDDEKKPREIWASLILPQDNEKLKQHLNSDDINSKDVKIKKAYFKTVSGDLYGC